MQIPRYDAPQTNISQLPGPHMSGSSPVANALEGAGRTVGGTGNEAMQFATEPQAKATQMVVLDASVKAGQSWLEIDKVARQRVGKDALDIKGPLDMYDQEYNKILNGIPGEEAKRQFKLHNGRNREQFEMNLERHASEQYNIMNQNNSKAKVEIEGQKLSTLYRDPSQYDTKNPDSQINKLRAAAADLMHIHGVSEGTPAWQEGMQAAEGKAYADRVRLLMYDNPAEAYHFFQVHQDDIPADEREQISKEIKTKMDAYSIDATLTQVKQTIKQDPNTEYDIEKAYAAAKTIEADPARRKLIYTELEHEQHMHDQALKQQYDANAGHILKGAHESWDKKQEVSVNQIKNSPEFGKMTEQQQAKLLDQVNAENWRLYVQKEDIKQRERASIRETNTREKEAEAQKHKAVVEEQNKESAYWLTHSEELSQLSDDEVQHLNVSHSDLKTIQSEKKKLTTPKALHQAKVADTAIKDILTRAGITGADEQQKLVTSAKPFIAAEQERKGAFLTPDETEAAMLKGFQYVYKDETEGHLIGKDTKNRVQKRRMEVKEKDVIYPDDVNKKVDDYFKTLSPEKRKLAERYKGRYLEEALQEKALGAK